MKLAEQFISIIKRERYEVFLDDRTERAGVKFNDSDLFGLADSSYCW